MNNPVITQALKDTLLLKPNIDKVYFDASGKHYLNVFELIEDKESKVKKLYGTGIYSHSQVIAGDWNIDKIQERICKGDKRTEIVTTLSREAVMKSKISGELASAELTSISLVEQISSLSKEDFAKLKEMFSEQKEVKKTATPPATPQATPPVAPAPAK